ncbi:MAG: F-box protein [Parachlamydiaceae bacterium]|nr:F-box protein [Parachlamydiaceae bacterium]
MCNSLFSYDIGKISNGVSPVEIQAQPQFLFSEVLPEIILQTFSILSIRELGVIGSVCRKFFIISNVNAVWKWHAERLIGLKNSFFSRSYNKFDFKSEILLKMQIKSFKIGLPDMIIYPNWYEETNYTKLCKAGVILSKGKIEFLKILSAIKYTELAVEAMKYLPNNGFIILHKTPNDTMQTLVYQDNEAIKITVVKDPCLNSSNKEQIFSIQKDKINIETVFPKEID